MSTDKAPAVADRGKERNAQVNDALRPIVNALGEFFKYELHLDRIDDAEAEETHG